MLWGYAGDPYISFGGSNTTRTSRLRLGDVFYLPAKVGFATLGVAASGMMYAATLGDVDATTIVWRVSTGGDYVITLSMVRRGDAPRFIGSVRPSNPRRAE